MFVIVLFPENKTVLFASRWEMNISHKSRLILRALLSMCLLSSKHRSGPKYRSFLGELTSLISNTTTAGACEIDSSIVVHP